MASRQRRRLISCDRCDRLTAKGTANETTGDTSSDTASDTASDTSSDTASDTDTIMQTRRYGTR